MRNRVYFMLSVLMACGAAGVAQGAAAPGVNKIVVSSQPKLTQQPQVSQIAPTATLQSTFDILHEGHLAIAQKFGLAPYSDAEFANKVLRQDLGLFIDVRARQKAGDMSMTWDITNGFKADGSDLSLVKSDIQKLFDGWPSWKLNAAAYSIGVSSMLDTLCGKNALAALDLSVAGGIAGVTPSEMGLLCGKKGAAGSLPGAGGEGAGLPNLGMPTPQEQSAKYVAEVQATLNSVGASISGNFCGRGWQAGAANSGTMNWGAGADTLSVPSENGGSGGADGVGPKGGSDVAAGGSGGGKDFCSQGATTGKSFVADTPSAEMQALKTKQKEAYEKYQAAKKEYQEKDEKLDEAKADYAQKQKETEWTKGSGESKEHLAQLKEQHAKSALGEAQTEESVAAAKEEDALKAVTAANKAVAEQKKKEEQQQAKDGGPGVDGNGLPPLCAGGLFDAALKCGGGGPVQVVKFVYDGCDPSGTQDGMPPPGQLKCEKNAVIADGQAKCECQMNSDGFVDCPFSGASAWAIDYSNFINQTGVIDPNPNAAQQQMNLQGGAVQSTQGSSFSKDLKRAAPPPPPAPGSGSPK